MINQEEIEDLATLREDLKLHPSIKTKDGFPSWTIYDPNNNKYFRIGWKEFEMLSRWHLRRPELLVAAVNSETTLTITIRDIKYVADFLAANNLVHHDADKAASVLYTQKLKSKRSLLSIFITNYLFFRVPLLNPDKFLRATAHLVKPLIHVRTLYALLVLLVVSLYLASRQWEEFKSTFMYFFNMEGMFFYGLTVTFLHIFHEFGHAYVANYFGCRVYNIGVVFIVLWPTMYTDNTDAWRLNSRAKQSAINIAGIAVETFIAAVALLLWSFLDDGILRSMCFFTATVSLVATLSINLNPLMRFDGYYILADLWGIDNLQATAFGLGKWRIREWLFKSGEPVPFTFPRKTQRLLILFAYIVWVYRFFLYLGIALMVYHLFFKVVGMLMMVIEIYALLIMPIWGELKVYYKMRNVIKFRKINLTFVTSVMLTCVAMVVPWQNKAHLPAIIKFKGESILYATESAILEEIFVKEGDIVHKGDVLARLYSPGMDMESKISALDIEIDKNKIRQDLQLLERLGDQITNNEKLNSDISKHEALVKKQEELKIIAPFSGKIVQLNEELILNTWIAKDTPMFELVDQDATEIEAYVEESDLNYINTKDQAIFTTSDFKFTTVAKVSAVDKTSTTELLKPYLASKFGGHIPVLEDAHSQKIVPAKSIYKILLDTEKSIGINKVTTGFVRLKKKPMSIIAKIKKAAHYMLIRETGF